MSLTFCSGQVTGLPVRISPRTETGGVNSFFHLLDISFSLLGGCHYLTGGQTAYLFHYKGRAGPLSHRLVLFVHHALRHAHAFSITRLSCSGLLPDLSLCSLLCASRFDPARAVTYSCGARYRTYRAQMIVWPSPAAFGPLRQQRILPVCLFCVHFRWDAFAPGCWMPFHLLLARGGGWAHSADVMLAHCAACQSPVLAAPLCSSKADNLLRSTLRRCYCRMRCRGVRHHVMEQLKRSLIVFPAPASFSVYSIYCYAILLPVRVSLR